ncbi:alkyl sulfatase dimerization domain-containing protein [Photobacterium rosenbergii]|uniref:alkyl sulfatase dimerization domain-containing protein n=1 Tax=Photobacterium rosenbergii TaxID=294936 RepID=UPI001C998124|nr:alkyl sulfatase dimerization domain-containing protein [Photobacterium rosenbergii]MBY5948877.1 hypothetical protein [Photobacterium rosenbergii]
MKLTLLSLLVGAFSLGAHATTSSTMDFLNETSPYYQGSRATKVAPNGALISDEMYQEIKDPANTLGTYTPNEMTYVKVAEGVHTFNAGGILNLNVVETENGIVIYDTGDDLHEADLFYTELRKHIDKPILAIVYSHEHYVGGAQHFIDMEAERGNEDILIIGHYNHNESVRASFAGVALHKEVSDVLIPRGANQFYSFIEKEGPRARGYTHHISLEHPKGIVDVNTPIDHNGQTIEIDGTEFVFYVDDIATDSANNVTVHIPDSGIVMNNALNGFLVNIYSIRGGAYRNPNEWVAALDLIESLEPKILLNTHSHSVNGEEEALRRIHEYQDAITSILNQTLMSIVKGDTRNAAAHTIKLPEVLEDSPYLRQNYGEIPTMIPQIYSAVVGSFNGEVADAIPMHPAAEADLIIRASGGQEATLEFAKKELENGNFHNALKLGKHLVNFDASHQPSIDFKVEAMYAMAEATMSHNLRSWYLSQARVLKGEIALPAALPAFPEAVNMNVLNYLENYRIRINHEKAGATEAKIGFRFDGGEEMALEIRNGVSYARDSIADSDVVLDMTPNAFTKLYNNLANIDQLVGTEEASVSSGELETASQLLGMFDVLYDWENDEGLKFILSVM